MAREFDVSVGGWPWEVLAGNGLKERFYVHPDSYSIFEPREGDLVENNETLKKRVVIMRNGKHFFMPKQKSSS